MSRRLPALLLLAATAAPGRADDEAAVRTAATFYASFDESLAPDFARGGKELATRYNHPTEKGQFVVEKGFDARAFRVARGKGVGGGCLEAADVLPRNGRVFYPLAGNLTYNKEGWGGAVSVWLDTDPDRLLKTGFCDPVQITQRGANDGGIWFDFNDAKPRDLRMGAFPAVAPGQKAQPESDPDAPMVRVPKVGLKQGDWHHVVLSWENFDTGRPDARAVLYIDGKPIGEVKGRALAMKWEPEKAGVYVAVNYIGLLDELALFGRPLTAAEVRLLHGKPGLLQPLKAPR